jgi:hypothetical protein
MRLAFGVLGALAQCVSNLFPLTCGLVWGCIKHIWSRLFICLLRDRMQRGGGAEEDEGELVVFGCAAVHWRR